MPFSSAFESPYRGFENNYTPIPWPGDPDIRSSIDALSGLIQSPSNTSTSKQSNWDHIDLIGNIEIQYCGIDWNDAYLFEDLLPAGFIPYNSFFGYASTSPWFSGHVTENSPSLISIIGLLHSSGDFVSFGFAHRDFLARPQHRLFQKKLTASIVGSRSLKSYKELPMRLLAHRQMYTSLGTLHSAIANIRRDTTAQENEQVAPDLTLEQCYFAAVKEYSQLAGESTFRHSNIHRHL